MHEDRVKAVLGHALAVASEADDFRDRELGPIHLLKYLYLGDLAHAEKHDGESFSGIPWRFHKFGPWAEQAFLQLEPTMAALGATRRSFAGQYTEDVIRWSLPPDRLAPQANRLPSEVDLAVARSVREFGLDTSALLHHVYRTYPMLRAAPGEPLDLRPIELEEGSVQKPVAEEIEMSKTKVKKLRALVRERLSHQNAHRSLVEPAPAPRYDEVFALGAAWLDGPEPEPISGRLAFSDDVWHSRARGDSELS